MRFSENAPRTIMELFKMLPEGTLAEIIDGSIYMSPSPTPRHQRIVGKLYRILTDYFEKEGLGEVLISPCDVYFDEASNAVQPDLIIISPENFSSIMEDAIHGVPDMLIEVLSPGNFKHDLIRKKQLYEKFGVKEYWAIDPRTGESLGFMLKDGKYPPPEKLTGKIKSVFLRREFSF